MKLFSADTETCLISPGCQAPPLVCLQFAYDNEEPDLVHVRDPACRRIVVDALSGGSLWNFQNLAFDVVVCMAKWPDLIEPFFDLFDRDEATCTIIRQKLLDIARGRFKVMSRRGYSLDLIAARHKLSLGLDKNDPWRMRYGELLDVPVHMWPEAARAYALKDVTAQRLVWHAQEAYAKSRNVPLVDQFRQARAALWIRLMECRGLMVDPRRTEAYIATVRETLEEDRDVCVEAGLVRSSGVKDTKAAMTLLANLCIANQEDEIPLTESGEDRLREMFNLKADADIPGHLTFEYWQKVKDKGPKELGVSLNEDAISLYGDELLESYQRYATSTTQLARAERLYLAARAGVPIQASFGTLQDSGRTSCSQGDKRRAADKTQAPTQYGAQLQNPARDKKVKRKDGTFYIRKGPRELYMARNPYFLCPTDWNSMELCAFATVAIRRVGFSKMAEVLIAGGDPHTELAAEVLGIAIEEAYATRKGKLGPEQKDYFDNYIRQSTKVGNFGALGCMGPDKLLLSARKQYGVVRDRPFWENVLKAFKRRWTEYNALTRWYNRQMEGEKGSEVGQITQLGSMRLRGGCWYAALRNTDFQGFAADIKKAACWRISRECYTGKCWDAPGTASPLAGCFLVNDVHDEPITELLRDRSHEAGFRQAEIQMQTSREWAPELGPAWKVEPALMTRWYKGAEAIYVNGRLTPWDYFKHSASCTKKDCHSTCEWLGDWRDHAA